MCAALLRLWFFLPRIFSSANKKKEYKYAELIKSEEESGEIDNMVQFKSVKAATDPEAYLKAYKMYCISTRIKSSKLYSDDNVRLTVTGFELFNEAGQKISNIVFDNKDMRTEEIFDQVSTMSDASLFRNEKKSEDALHRVTGMKKFLPLPKR